jgi:6-phosphogluconolactonase
MALAGTRSKPLTQSTRLPIVQIDSSENLAHQLADAIVEKLQNAIEADGKASLVVSGGSTPKPLFEALSQRALRWSAVTVTLADERWVPESSADSNATFVKTHLLKDLAADATFVSLYENDKTPHEGVSVVNERMTVVPQPFTVVVLGMGGDGHTASLFPDAPGTEAAMAETESLVSIVEPTTVPQARITLTLKALMNTDCQFLHISGQDKRALVDEVLKDPAQSSYPIAQFLKPENLRITLYSTH